MRITLSVHRWPLYTCEYTCTNPYEHIHMNTPKKLETILHSW